MCYKFPAIHSPTVVGLRHKFTGWPLTNELLQLTVTGCFSGNISWKEGRTLTRNNLIYYPQTMVIGNDKRSEGHSFNSPKNLISAKWHVNLIVWEGYTLAEDKGPSFRNWMKICLMVAQKQSFSRWVKQGHFIKLPFPQCTVPVSRDGGARPNCLYSVTLPQVGGPRPLTPNGRESPFICLAPYISA